MQRSCLGVLITAGVLAAIWLHLGITSYSPAPVLSRADVDPAGAGVAFTPSPASMRAAGLNPHSAYDVLLYRDLLLAGTVCRAWAVQARETKPGESNE